MQRWNGNTNTTHTTHKPLTAHTHTTARVLCFSIQKCGLCGFCGEKNVNLKVFPKGIRATWRSWPFRVPLLCGHCHGLAKAHKTVDEFRFQPFDKMEEQQYVTPAL